MLLEDLLEKHSEERYSKSYPWKRSFFKNSARNFSKSSRMNFTVLTKELLTKISMEILEKSPEELLEELAFSLEEYNE